MLENVFSKTKLVEGERTLSIKYSPRNVSECCISDDDVRITRHHLENERHFAVYSKSGCGATTCVECIANEMSFFVHKLTCSVGCVEIVKLLRRNMKNVLLALQLQTKEVLFFIKDIEIMKRNERIQIISAIEELNIRAVLFFNDTMYSTKWKTIRISPPSFDDKMIHLCWICAEEEINLGDTNYLEKIEYLATFHDLRYAINSLILTDRTDRNTAPLDRDYNDIDDFSKALFAHENLNCKSTDEVLTFTELMCCMDISEFKPTRYWFIEHTGEYIDKHFTYTRKQSLVARHAQLTHRCSCLQKSCRLLHINYLELKEYSFLYRNMILNHNINPLKIGVTDYDDRAKALYTISKIGATPPQCKAIKKKILLK